MSYSNKQKIVSDLQAQIIEVTKNLKDCRDCLWDLHLIFNDAGDKCFSMWLQGCDKEEYLKKFDQTEE